jgi:hypothetical protein
MMQQEMTIGATMWFKKKNLEKREGKQKKKKMMKKF